MTRLPTIALWALCAALAGACSENEPEEATPHEPVLPTPILAEEDTDPDEPEAEGAANDTQPPTQAEAEGEGTAGDAPTTNQPQAKSLGAGGAEAPPSKSAPKPRAERSRPAPQPPAEKPSTAAEAPKASNQDTQKAAEDEPASRTRIPNDAHVRVVVPRALQARLDSDSRMQGWINKVMAVAKRCYGQVRAKDPTAGGTILVHVTMHENQRPSPDIKQLPPKLSSLVACATGKLFSVRMPLFTGPEGEGHLVKLHFKP